MNIEESLWLIANGWLPMWSWKRFEFEWLPSDALMKALMDAGEIG